MKAMTLNEILGDFEPAAASESASRKEGKPLTLWVSAEIHARFARLQKTSGRDFGKKVKEAVQAMIDLAEARAG